MTPSNNDEDNEDTLARLIWEAQQISALPQPDSAGLIAEAREAMEPFARYYELNDCEEHDPREAVEVPIADLRRARKAFAALSTAPAPVSGDDWRDIVSAQVCIACGKPWDGKKCGQAENGHPFPVCTPTQFIAESANNHATLLLRQCYVTLAFAFRRLHGSSRSRDGELCLDFQKVRAEIEKHFKRIGVKL